ncbi:MAG: hypothetical protein DI604_10015 [Delftia acidovorans]|nr:MAG: hypothetical protein DI604_10015 [Delftia acidovorans]
MSAARSSCPCRAVSFRGRVSARQPTPFLDSPRKVRSKKATRMSATLRFAAGNLRRGGCGVRRETRCALRASLKHHGESDDEASLSFGRLATPQPPRRRRGHTGGGRGSRRRQRARPGLSPWPRCSLELAWPAPSRPGRIFPGHR